MTIKIRLTYHSMDGEGATVREAKADAGRKIERALAEMSKAPVIVSVDGRVALVAYDPGCGWGHLLIAYPGDDAYPRPGPQYVSGAFATQHEAILHAARHVLDLCWEPDAEDDDARYDAITSKPFGAPMNHTEQSEMRRKILEGWAWQRNYRKARDAGHSDEEARNIAFEQR